MKRLRTAAIAVRNGWLMDAVALLILTVAWAIYCHVRPRKRLYSRRPNASD